MQLEAGIRCVSSEYWEDFPTKILNSEASVDFFQNFQEVFNLRKIQKIIFQDLKDLCIVFLRFRRVRRKSSNHRISTRVIKSYLDLRQNSIAEVERKFPYFEKSICSLFHLTISAFAICGTQAAVRCGARQAVFCCHLHIYIQSPTPITGSLEA